MTGDLFSLHKTIAKLDYKRSKLPQLKLLILIVYLDQSKKFN